MQMTNVFYVVQLYQIQLHVQVILLLLLVKVDIMLLKQTNVVPALKYISDGRLVMTKIL